MQRIVITGLGCVSPLGLTVEAFASGLPNGACGIGPIARFDAATFPQRLAAEVKGFEPRADFDLYELTYLDLFAQFALVSAREAVAAAGLRFDGALAS